MEDQKSLMSNGAFSMGENRWKGKTDAATRVDRWWTQFSTMLWKNSLTLWRRPVTLVLMLILPSVVLPVFTISTKEEKSSSSELYMAPVPLTGLGSCRVDHANECIFIAYGPTNALANSVMGILADNNGLEIGSDIVGFASASDAETYTAENLGTVQYVVEWGVSGFTYALYYNNTLPSTDMSKTTSIDFEAVVLKKELDKAIMQYHNPSTVFDVNLGYLAEVVLDSRFAVGNGTTQCDWDTMDYQSLQVIAPLVVIVGLTVVSFLAFNVVGEERTKGLVTAYRRLGGADSAYWLAWFVTFELIVLAASGLATAIASGMPVDFFRSIDLSAYFWLNFMYLTAMVADACVLSSFVSSQSLSVMMVFATFLILVITVCSTFGAPLSVYRWTSHDSGPDTCELIPSSYNVIYSPNFDGYDFVQFLVFFMPWFHGGKILSDMLSITHYSDEKFTMDELGRERTMYHSDERFDAASSEASILTLFYETLLYMGLAWLLGLIVSNEGGEGRSIITVLFPQQLRDAIFGPSTAPIFDGDVRGTEKELSRRDNTIRLYKLSKTYSGVQALKEATLEMRNGEVFGLLGHNGAGKSTMINVLTGLAAPTHGKVFIQGRDIATDVADVQQFIGVCAQDDLLWDELTAREHLMFFARLKGITPGPALEQSVDEILDRVQLKRRSDSLARYFSGGMKRRLSVAMSVVGDVSVVFLDEPTTGLDVMNRRRIWEMINWIKIGRIVVLTTHNMEEADFLSDQICFLHGGRVRAIGDSLFLKQNYGKGYQLNLVAQPSIIPTLQAGIAAILPGAEFADGQNPMTGTLTLTVSRRVVHRLPRFFAWLERSPQAARAIREWGISNTTLEQVFLKLCVQNNEINFSDSKPAIIDTLCLLCQLRPREPVTVHTVAGIPFVLSDAICKQCAAAPPTATLPAEAEPNDADGLIEFGAAELIQLPGLDALLGPLEQGASSVDSHHAVEAKHQEKGESPTRNVSSLEIGFNQPTKSLQQAGSFGVWYSQVKATMVKNGQLQRRQRWSNCCMVFYVLVLFLLLYIFALVVPQSAFATDTCDQGYEAPFIFGDCSIEDLVDTLFTYPSPPSLPYFSDRERVVWNSLTSPSEESDYSILMAFPHEFATSEEVNGFIAQSQQDVVNQVAASSYFPGCTEYYPVPAGVTDEASAFDYFKQHFADAAFYCPSCQPNATYTFQGDIWMAFEQDSHYEYGFLNFPVVNGTLNRGCPAGFSELTMLADYSPDSVVCGFLELLANEMLKDTGIEITSSFLAFGELNFPGDDDLEVSTFIMVLIGMLILNGFWPLTVWRLAYERNAGLITMMRTVGVQTSAYIGGMLAFDMVIYILNGIVLLGIAVGLDFARFGNVPFGDLVAIVLVSALCFNASALVLVRVLSKSPRLASLLAAIGCIALTVCACLINWMVYPDNGDWPLVLSLVPFFAQGRAFYELFMNEEATTNTGLSLVLMVVVSIASIVFTFILDAEITLHQMQLRMATLSKGTRFEAMFNRRRAEEDDVENALRAPLTTQADSVGAEEELAKSCELDRFPIVIRELTHTYPATRNSAANFAVRGVSVTMRAGECFGLLGPNGAGKSTTISILSGILEPSGGSIFIGGGNIAETKLPIHQLVGICPQFDIIWEELTVEQHLSFQARVRGFAGAAIRAETQRAACAVALDGDAYQTPAGKLSGGMRRRLSIGMAIVGNPSIIYLDEPTTGLDPDNRRHVWEIIQSLKTPERLILLTTHSMDEAEALCSRIGIMAQGSLQCLGSSYELKKQFDHGYILSINLNEVLPRDVQSADEHHPFHAIHQFVTSKLAGGAAELVSAGNKTLKYNLAKSSTSISRVFQLMENNKASLGVREWGLSMTTLEEVFVSAVNSAGSAN